MMEIFNLNPIDLSDPVFPRARVSCKGGDRAEPCLLDRFRGGVRCDANHDPAVYTEGEQDMASDRESHSESNQVSVLWISGTWGLERQEVSCVGSPCWSWV